MMGHGWIDEDWDTSGLYIGWSIVYHELQTYIQVLTILTVHLRGFISGQYIFVHATNQWDHKNADHTTDK